MINTLDLSGFSAFIGDLDCLDIIGMVVNVVDLSNVNSIPVMIINLGPIATDLGSI